LANGEFETRFCDVRPIWRWPDIGGNALIVVQLREPRAAKAAVVRHFDDCGATKCRSDNVYGGIRPREAGAHHNPSNIVRSATAWKTTMTNSDIWAHNLLRFEN